MILENLKSLFTIYRKKAPKQYLLKSMPHNIDRFRKTGFFTDVSYLSDGLLLTLKDKTQKKILYGNFLQLKDKHNWEILTSDYIKENYTEEV